MRFGCLVTLFIEALLACADNGKNLLLGEVDLSDRVVFGVAQIDKVLVLSIYVTEALGVVKLGLFIGTIDKSDATVANNSRARHSLFIQNYQPIVARVSYH